jgi:hypothetical protein
MTNEELRKIPDFDARMAQAKARAQWELGSVFWASVIIGAFLYPEDDAKRLAEAKGETGE